MKIGSTTEAGTAEQRKALKKACSDMEGMFMNMLLKSMRKTVQKTDLFGSDREEEMFRDMMDSEVCSKAATTQSIGIADMLYRQLAPRMEANGSGESAKTDATKAQAVMKSAQDEMVGLDARTGQR